MRRLSTLVMGAGLVLAAGAGAAAAEPGEISGRVTTRSGVGIATCVTAYDNDWTWITQGCSDDSGAYTLTGLLDGVDYRLQVDPAGDYLGEWAQDAADFDQATPYQAGSTVNVVLDPGAVVQGTLTQADATPAADVGVNIEGLAEAGWAMTDAQGAWRAVVRPGAYRVQFSTPVPQYAFGAVDRTDATVFTLRAGETTTVDDRVLSHGVVTGRVTDLETGAPLGDVCARLVDPAADPSIWQELGSGCTDSQGRYSLSATRPGTFTVVFTDSAGRGYSPIYAGNVVRVANAKTFEVTDSSTSTVSARLRMGSTVTGRVVDATTGAGVAHMCPTAFYGRTSERVLVAQDSCSDNGGYYSIQGMPSTNFTVSLRPQPRTPYSTVWAGGALDQSKATQFKAVAPQLLRLGTTRLTTPGAISGVVKDFRGQPVAGAWVDLSGRMVGRMGHGDAPYEGQTDDQGRYTIYAPPGVYTPIAYEAADLAPEWSGDATRRELARPITVRSGRTASWSPWLSPASFITGTAVLPADSDLAGTYFDADIWSLSGDYLGSLGARVPDGNFTSSSLPPGDVVLKGFIHDPFTGDSVPITYDGTATPDNPTVVSVGPRQTVEITWHLP